MRAISSFNSLPPDRVLDNVEQILRNVRKLDGRERARVRMRVNLDAQTSCKLPSQWEFLH